MKTLVQSLTLCSGLKELALLWLWLKLPCATGKDKKKTKKKKKKPKKQNKTKKQIFPNSKEVYHIFSLFCSILLKKTIVKYRKFWNCLLFFQLLTGQNGSRLATHFCSSLFPSISFHCQNYRFRLILLLHRCKYNC